MRSELERDITEAMRMSDYNEMMMRLWMEPVNILVLRQMSGILTTSFIILIILGFSFWFLIRTILKQKTLEEMKSDFTLRISVRKL